MSTLPMKKAPVAPGAAVIKERYRNPMTTTESISAPSIYSLVRSALRESISPDPKIVAATVVAGIPDDMVRTYLTTAVMAMIPSIQGQLSTPVPRPNRSAKVAGIRDEWWPKFLQQRVLTADGWKFLRDVSVEDLRFVAAHKREQAQELLARAAVFDYLADRMEQQGVDRLADLDSSDISNLGDAA